MYMFSEQCVSYGTWYDILVLVQFTCMDNTYTCTQIIHVSARFPLHLLLEVSPEQLPVVTCIVLGCCSHWLVWVGLNVPFVGNRTDV